MILVSRCLLGEACRYDGKSKVTEFIQKELENWPFEGICPEVDGGLSTPREPSEIRKEGESRKVINRLGQDVTEAFEKGAMHALDLCKKKDIHYAILKERSPSCGVNQIYDGNFSGEVINGQGKTAQLLIQNGVEVFSESTVPIKKIKVYDFLQSHDIAYKKYKHPRAYTVEEAKELIKDIQGQLCKNLFLRNAKGNQHYLVILQQDRPFSMHAFRNIVKDSHLSLASPQRLSKYLGVESGSVGVFGLLNDKDNHVKVYVDKNFDTKGLITFHPNDNDETLELSYSDFERCIRIMGYVIQDYI